MNLDKPKIEDIEKDEIHWWQFPLVNFSVKFNDIFKSEFFHKVYSERSNSLEFATHINKVSKRYGKNWNFKRQRHLLWSYKKETKFIPAWFVYESASYLDIDLRNIEKNIIGYLTFRGKTEIYCPKLPIKVTPEFTAIAIHTMCDGHFSKCGKITYAQKDNKNLIRFINILENIFGKYQIIPSRRKDAVPTTNTPGIFGKIISNYFYITDFSTFKCKIPNKIKLFGRFHKLAVLSSFLVDEGHTSAGIVFSSSSRAFLEDINYIAKSLGYGCNSIVTYLPNEKNKRTQNHYKFSLSAFSLEKFYLDKFGGCLLHPLGWCQTRP
jgi:hypothetical protein